MSVTPTPRNAGDQFAYIFTITNAGDGSGASTLMVNLPSQVAYNGSIVDRGPGCSVSGQTLSCPLDFFPSGLQDTVIVGAKVASTGTLVMTSSTSSFPADVNPSDSNTSVTLQVGTSAVQAPFVPPSAPRAKPVPAAIKLPALAFSKLTKILLEVKHPSLALTFEASGGTTLTIELANSRGHNVAGWDKHAHKGRNAYKLVLPLAARHAGHDTLRITEAHSRTRTTLPVTLSAS